MAALELSESRQINGFVSAISPSSSLIIGQCPVVGRRPQHEASQLACLVLYRYLYIILISVVDQVELWTPRQVTHLPPVRDLLLPLA